MEFAWWDLVSCVSCRSNHVHLSSLQFIHGSRMTLTSDCNEEFFDARSDIGCAPPDDLLSDDDSDDGDEYVPSVATPEPLSDQNHLQTLGETSSSSSSDNLIRSSSGEKLRSLNRLSLTRSTSDTDLTAKSNSRNFLDCDGLQKSKSASSDMEQATALYRKQEAERQAKAKGRYR